MNVIFTALFAIAFVFAAVTGHGKEMSAGLFKGVKDAVEISIGLVGAISLWLGMVKILEKAGAVDALSRLVGPVVRRIFPGLPKDHPAVAAITLNIAANMLGLGNAATPFGLKAMEEMDKLNPKKGILSDPMALFLAINTASVTLVPATVIALRAGATPRAATQPADILVPTLLSSLCATAAAILGARLLSRLAGYRKQYEQAEDKGGGAP